jgi:hypothetical protein
MATFEFHYSVICAELARDCVICEIAKNAEICAKFALRKIANFRRDYIVSTQFVSKTDMPLESKINLMMSEAMKIGINVLGIVDKPVS